MTYGLSKEINSYLYDPEFTYSITINGQLSLLMITEMFWKFVKDLKILQINTDGITIKFKKKDYDKVMKICKRFEEITKQELEYAEYSKMVINDVNNYIAIYTNGKAKKKGLFETELDYHKNPSFLVVPKALEQKYVYGKDPFEFIDNHSDIYDFCGGFKKRSTFALNIYNIDNGIIKIEEQQKVTRVYVAKDGGMFIKDFYDGRQMSILKRYKVKQLNTIENEEYHLKNINKEWYKKEVRKIIDNLEYNNLTLNFNESTSN